MMTAEHRRPLAAFFTVLAAACLILGNGLRSQFVDVWIGAAAPPGVAAPVDPDMVLGQSLRDAPKPVRPTLPRQPLAEVAATGDVVVAPEASTGLSVGPSSQVVTASVDSVSQRVTSRRIQASGPRLLQAPGGAPAPPAAPSAPAPKLSAPLTFARAIVPLKPAKAPTTLAPITQGVVTSDRAHVDGGKHSDGEAADEGAAELSSGPGNHGAGNHGGHGDRKGDHRVHSRSWGSSQVHGRGGGRSDRGRSHHSH